MKYRPEIDGLRAIAVLPVILFHAGIPPFSGGFVGVDIFFVISGFLITHILINELQENSFSLLGFYERRVRRILPALFTVVLCCVPFAFMWMMPNQYENFSRSLISVVLFISNLHFWVESDYFGDATEEMPLLHTWSLAIEEQFYLFFPPVLWLLWRFGPRGIAFYAVVAAGIISLALCEYASYHHPSANFFLLPMRAWELCMGAICAFLVCYRTPKANNWLALVGLAIIVYANVAFTEHTRFPSLYAMLPVGGAALIILFARTNTWVARLLSLKVMVGVGLISYSAYLWHQPLFAFARIYFVEGAAYWIYWVLCFVTLILAYLSWRYVEQPFRKRGADAIVSNKQLTISMSALALLVVAIGAYGMLTDGRFERWKQNITPKQLHTYEMIEQARNFLYPTDNEDCRFNLTDMTPEFKTRVESCREKYGPGILLIGDSHMMDIYNVIDIGSDTQAFPFVAGMTQMCRPGDEDGQNCGAYAALTDYLETQPGLFTDIIYTQAGFYFINDPLGEQVDRMNLRYAPFSHDFADHSVKHDYIEQIYSYLSQLTPYAKVIWMASRIEPSFTHTAITRLGCDYPYTMRKGHAKLYRDAEKAIEKKLNDSPIKFVSQIQMLKFDMSQEFMNCERTYWADGDHFSYEGEKLFSKRINLHTLPLSKSP